MGVYSRIVLMIEMYKTHNNTITFGIDSMKFRGSLLWNSIHDLIKRA